MKRWTEIEPADAVSIVLPRADIVGPMNELGEECPWPWEPQQLTGAPLGQYHCPYCLGMVMAGIPHLDYREDVEVDMAALRTRFARDLRRLSQIRCEQTAPELD